MKVIVIDDTDRRNVCMEVTDEYRAEYFKQHKILLPPSIKFLPIKNGRQQVQEKVEVEYVYEGRGLEVAINRAKRFMRNNITPFDAPKHIKLAMKAFKQADPKDFEKCLA